MPDLMTAAQAAERLKVSLRTVQRAAKDKRIGTRLGKAWVFTRDDLPRLKAAIPGQTGNPAMRTESGQRRLQRLATKAGRGRKKSIDAATT